MAGGAALRPASVAKGGCGTPPPSILRAHSLSHSRQTVFRWAHALSRWAHGAMRSPPQQNHAVSAMRMYPTLCVAAARGRGGEGRRHQGRTCYLQMCAALQDREVLHDLVVGAAFGRTIEDFATMRWRGHRRSNAGFWGFGAVGPQDRKREKRALHDPILTQQQPLASSSHFTRDTSPDSTTSTRQYCWQSDNLQSICLYLLQLQKYQPQSHQPHDCL